MRLVTLSLVSGLAIATAVATPALAQQPRTSPSGDVVAAGFTAEVTGQVQAVDPSSGMLRLQTVDGPVTVRFPPPAVAAIQPGDTVTVAFGLVKPAPAASPPSTTPRSPMPGSSPPPTPSIPGAPTTPGTR